MMQVSQDYVEILIANARKPISYSNYSYPLNDLDDRVYEVLTYSIFKRRISSKDPSLGNRYDDIQLMQGVGEKGMDCVMLRNDKTVATIQCKKYSKNLTDVLILAELTKFAIHFSQDPGRFSLAKKFKYIISTTTGYSGKALRLPALLRSKEFLQEYDFPKIMKGVLAKYKEFKGISYEDLENKIPNLISSFEYEMLGPSDFDLWINGSPEILSTFFEVRKVTDNDLVEKKGNEIIAKIDELFSEKDVDALSNFRAKYKAVAIAKLNLVNFIGFDLHRYRQKPTDITLTELFVQPSFRQRISEKNAKSQSVVGKDLKIANVFKSDKNIILLGDPGAGKSLLVKFVMVQILSGTADSIGLRQYAKFIPFRIELRKYNEVREGKSIIEYLAELLTREYQSPVSSELLDKIISGADSILFFDGLDEIFNVTHKNKMKECIESFGAAFPRSKCVVTSRFIGYHDIKFNSKKFDEFAIQRFSNRQIEDLVEKFYSTQISNAEKRKNLIATCKSQIEKDIDQELKSNPLIMTLILILASNNIVIPDSKLEIYEACTKTLVDSIDTREKELKIDVPVKNKRVIFAHLAYWQYESLSKNNEISYDRAIKSISELLIDRREATEFADAEEMARRFLEYAEKRSIYFEDSFTHKTFLEYYTGDYLYVNYFTKASDSAKRKGVGIIATYLSNSFWYIVFELLFTRIDKEQADSDLLDEIFSKQVETGNLNVCYFLVSNLPKLVNVGDEIRKKIIRKTILLCIKGEKVTGIRRGYEFEESSLVGKISQLQNNDGIFELFQQVASELEDELILNDKQATEFYIFMHELASMDHKIKPKHTLQIANKDRLLALSYLDLHLYCQARLTWNMKSGVIGVEVLLEQIEHFGTESIFLNLDYRHREDVHRIDTFDWFLIGAIREVAFRKLQAGYQMLLAKEVVHSRILEHLRKTRTYFFFRGVEEVVSLIKLFLKSDDDAIDELLMVLIRNAPSLKAAYDRVREKENHTKLRTIERLLKM